MTVFLASQLSNYYALKSQVEEKWDLVTLLLMLLFFLVCMALFFAVMRPEGVVRKTVALCLILPISFMVSSLLIENVVAKDVRNQACLELMEKTGRASGAEKRCARGNPIKLEFTSPAWKR